MRNYLIWLLFFVGLIGIGSALHGCYYETVGIPADRGSGPISCYSSGELYFFGQLTITGTISEAIIDSLEGSWILCSLTQEEKQEAKNFCDIEFRTRTSTSGDQ